MCLRQYGPFPSLSFLACLSCSLPSFLPSFFPIARIYGGSAKCHKLISAPTSRRFPYQVRERERDRDRDVTPLQSCDCCSVSIRFASSVQPTIDKGSLVGWMWDLDIKRHQFLYPRDTAPQASCAQAGEDTTAKPPWWRGPAAAGAGQWTPRPGWQGQLHVHLLMRHEECEAVCQMGVGGGRMWRGCSMRHGVHKGIGVTGMGAVLDTANGLLWLGWWAQGEGVISFPGNSQESLKKTSDRACIKCI